jgi:primosomal protein N' (replication factor Y) (superfamily II helicase)
MQSVVDESDTVTSDGADVVRYVSVVVLAEGPFREAPLTYAQPDDMLLAVGDAVLVPFGASRDVIGYVVALDQSCDPNLISRVKAVRARIDGASAFDESLWTLARWVCEQTLSDPRDVVRLIAPPLHSAQIKTIYTLAPDWANLTTGIRSPGQKLMLERLANHPDLKMDSASLSRGVNASDSCLSALRKRKAVSIERTLNDAPVKQKNVRVLMLATTVAEAEVEAVRLESRRGEKQAAVLRRLIAISEMADPVLLIDSADSTAAKALVEKGIAKSETRLTRRDPFGTRSRDATVAPGLTDEQASAVKAIGEAMDGDVRQPFLLYGVTGSGKTEVYLDAIERTRRVGKGAIFLLPEIGLTTQVMDLLQARFGDDVAVLHSALSDGERHDEWQRIVRGDATIVVGARSAIFAPVKDLGLIVVDEEHESSFKQDTVPRYHARDVARFRARQAKAVLVLGSATPSIESYYYAIHDIYRLITLTKRVAERPLPPVIIVDQRTSAGPQAGDDSASNRALSIISGPLQTAIGNRLEMHQQAILFINRRGFSTFLLCRDCGYSFKCPNCDVTLTYHRSAHLLQCHHCGHKLDAVDICPQCCGRKLRPFGLGTEKVEEAVLGCFPQARTIRMDRDTTEHKGAHASLLGRFRKFEADILIGTQMVAKGLDFPNVTLVGVISADTALNIPDYRASERAFQLLTQVAGRAGRGESLGEVFVQTFDPEHESIRFAQKHDYVGFYNKEIVGRQSLHYPPFGFLANIVSSDTREGEAKSRIDRIARLLLQEIVSTNQQAIFEVLGPVVCPLGRLKNRFRHHVVVRCRKRKPMLQLLKDVYEMIGAADRGGLSLDIDPITML